MKNRYVFIFVLILLSLTINLSILSRDKILLGGDDSHILFTLSKNLYEGKGYTLFGSPHFLYPPLTSIATVIFFKLFGISEFTAVLTSIFFSALTIILCFTFVEYFTNTKIAFITTALMTVHFDFIYLSTILRVDIPFMFFLYLFLFFLSKGFSSEGKGWFYLAAVAAGFANLSKYILGPMFFFVLAYLFYRKRKDALNLVILMMIIFVLLNSPWLYRNYHYHSNPFYSDYNSVLGMYNNPADVTLKGVQQSNDDYYVGSRFRGIDTLKFLFSGIFVKKIIINAASNSLYFLPKAIGLVMLFFAILNLISYSFEEIKKQWLLIFIVIYVLAIATISAPHLKYYTFLSPIFIMWGIQGCFKLTNLVFKDRSWKVLMGGVLIVLIFHSYVYTLIPTLVGNRITSRFENPPLEGKAVGLWLKENTSPDASVMAVRIDFSQYGDRKYYLMPLGSFEKVKEYAKRKKIDYLVYDNAIAFYWRPELRTLLNDSEKEGLKLIYKYKDPNRIYGDVFVWQFLC